MFYLKLAMTNLKKNRRAYTPFLASMIFLIVVNVVMRVLLTNKGMSELPSAMAAKSLFGFGSVVIMIFTVIFSLYTNSFLLKQRKKELGLYNILGLGKKELARVLFLESLVASLFSIVAGLISGIIFSKLSFLILKKISGFGEDFTYSLDAKNIGLIVLFFVAVFLVLFILNVIQLKMVNPLELLGGSQHGEKEPKAKWLTALIGIVCIGAGYFISVTIQSPLEAITQFFIAVVLVIIGTYALFTASSIVVLKLLKRNKRYYYQPNHFISVSSMMYRMKQNAVGLASICVLSTMVLVTVATTASLYFGMDDVTNNRNPYDVSLSTSDKKQIQNIEKTYKETAKKHDIRIKEVQSLEMSGGMAIVKKSNQYQVVDFKTGSSMKELSQAEMLSFMTEAEYNRLTKENLLLKDKEAVVFSMEKPYEEKTMNLAGDNLKVVKTIDKLSFIPQVQGVSNVLLVILANQSDIKQAIQSLYGSNQEQKEFQKVNYTVYANLVGSQKNQQAFSREIKKEMSTQYPGETFTSASLDREESKNFMGGFLFLGLIFGLTFTLATGIIIYYKQISEGNQDQQRYDIMQKVGMSHAEVKKTIQSQIWMVFFFPIALAALHLAFAFPMIQKMLVLFGLSNWIIFLTASVIVVISFLVIYLGMFMQTSKSYYRIVERQH
ncbi:FtsX-like permease family protein [Vagococcus vulneris]|uniref:ABC3 transporter permease C-terminal domain-containing protein n=1 Tax=Vagococcus vulneris TaxID=1977869 RepID=A0A429ZYS2_9ENTE|nr:ABC transporter permease [Vagococcus vulneris]RST99123.1 hypothetical protein CBF37_05505 [Vagococcus vulneris]